jgi:signal transduction histidine kinase
MRRSGYGLRAVVVSTFALAVTVTTVAISLIAYAVVRSQASTFQETSDRGNFQHLIDLAAVNVQLKDTLLTEARSGPGAVAPADLTAYLQNTLDLRFAAVVDPQHPSADCTYRPCWSDFPPRIQAAATAGQTYIGGPVPPDRRSNYWLAITPLDASIGDGHLVLASSALGISGEPSYRALWQRTAIVVGAGLLLAVLAGLAVSASIRRPLKRITGATERFGRGDVLARAPAGGSDELRRLGATFNATADQLQTTLGELHAAQDQQRRFVADVAHELRSPLSTMLATLDSLDAAQPTRRQRSTTLLAEQTRRLAGLVEDLLEISRFDAGQAELRSELVDLTALAGDAARSVSGDVDIPITAHGSSVRLVDPRRMHTVVRNLVSNAIRHGLAPVAIELTGHADGTLSLTVTDEGAGIPAEQQASIFDRFAQGTPARRGGTGLGLAIVQENVRLHGGTLSVSDSAPTRFTVTLPASTAVPQD